MKKIFTVVILCMILTACAAPTGTQSSSSLTNRATLPTPVSTATAVQPSATDAPTRAAASATAKPATGGSTSLQAALTSGSVPNFDHIILIVLENRSYEEVIGNSAMPHLNDLAKQYVLLTNDYAVRHPSLPNYLSLVSGSNQGVTSDCTNCFVNAPNLADEIEKSGRTWKAYEEGMPSPCYLGDSGNYAQKHDPFLYFDSIRLDPARCTQSIVPMTQLDTDLAASSLPNFSFIMPDLCNSGHNCGQGVADSWVYQMVTRLQNSAALGQKSLIIITFDEGNEKSTASCCGMGKKAGGRVATVLISPLAKPGFTDGTAVSHYGILKTILVAWGLPDLGNTSLPQSQSITQPWK